MKPLHLIALGLGFAVAVPGTTLAQAYKWRDEKGGMVFSDTPPPPNIPRANILQAPKGMVPAVAPATGSVTTASPAMTSGDGGKTGAAAPKSVAEREADYKKRQLQAQKKTKEDAEKNEREQQRLANCEAQRQNLVSMESGQRIARTDSKGERYFVDDEQRAKDVAKARQDMIAAKCN